jgi:hypothetical protein
MSEWKSLEELRRNKPEALECMHPQHGFVVLPQDPRHTLRLQVVFESASG